MRTSEIIQGGGRTPCLLLVIKTSYIVFLCYMQAQKLPWIVRNLKDMSVNKTCPVIYQLLYTVIVLIYTEYFGSYLALKDYKVRVYIKHNQLL